MFFVVTLTLQTALKSLFRSIQTKNLLSNARGLARVLRYLGTPPAANQDGHEWNYFFLSANIHHYVDEPPEGTALRRVVGTAAMGSFMYTPVGH